MNWKHLEHCEVEKCNKERPELLKPHIKQKEVMQHNGKRPSALNVFWNILALNLKEVYCKGQAQMKLQRSLSFFFFFLFYLHIPGHLHMVTVKDSPGLQS